MSQENIAISNYLIKRFNKINQHNHFWIGYVLKVTIKIIHWFLTIKSIIHFVLIFLKDLKAIMLIFLTFSFSEFF